MTINSGLAKVVIEAQKSAFSVKSDFARKEAEFVAMAASLGLISTKVHQNVFSRHWHPTVSGLMFLETNNIYMTEPEEQDPLQIDLFSTIEREDNTNA